MGILSDKLLWSAGPAIAGADRGFDRFSPNQAPAESSLNRALTGGSLLDSGWAQAGAALAGLAVPGAGMAAKAIDMSQRINNQNAVNSVMGTPAMDFGDILGRALSPSVDIDEDVRHFRHAALSPSAAPNIAVEAALKNYSSPASLNYAGAGLQTPAPSLGFGVAPSVEHMSTLAADRNNIGLNKGKGSISRPGPGMNRGRDRARPGPGMNRGKGKGF